MKIMKSLGLKLNFILIFWSSISLAIVGVPDDKRFIDCKKLSAKEISADNSNPAKPLSPGSTYINACFDTLFEEWVVIKAAKGITLEFLRNESLFFHLTSEIPSVIKRYETFIDPEWRYEILEYCPDGDIYERLEMDGSFSEDDARPLFRQMAAAVFELHKLKIVHLDIKPENFFFLGNIVKIGDFGFSEYLKEQEPSYQIKGTSSYLAPEIAIKQKGGTYDPYPADVFSLGTTLFVMITGGNPFSLAHPKDGTYRYMLTHKVKGLLKHYNMTHLSESLVDLLQKMLEDDPKKRASIKEILQHPWLAQQPLTGL